MSSKTMVGTGATCFSNVALSFSMACSSSHPIPCTLLVGGNNGPWNAPVNVHQGTPDIMVCLLSQAAMLSSSSALPVMRLNSVFCNSSRTLVSFVFLIGGVLIRSHRYRPHLRPTKNSGATYTYNASPQKVSQRR
jgi:hypothetical protein